MSWERYSGQQQLFPELTLRKSGSIGLNTAAVSRFGFDKAPFVMLYYDKVHRRMGLQLDATGDKPGAFKIRVKNGKADIMAKKFLDHFGVEHAADMRYSILRSEADSMLIVDLKTPKT
jgi:hypothetical protein